MKRFSFLAALAAMVALMMIAGCAGSESPSRADLDKVLKGTPLEGLSV